MMDVSLRQKFQMSLAPNEEVLWTGQPRQGLVLRSQDIFMIPFSILWAGFAIFWETAVIAGGAPFFFMLWGVPFVLVGLYMVIGRFFIDAYQRSKIFYALTNKRVVVKNEGPFGKTTSYEVRSITNLSVETGKDGRGTVVLGPSPVGRIAMRGFAWPGMSNYLPPALDMIPDAEQVYRMIQDLREQ